MNQNLEKIRQNKFLILGRAGVDFYADPPGTRTENGEVFTMALGGSSANIAVAICKFGGDASLVTCVSDDAVGRLAINQVRKYGIDASRIRSVGGEARTSLAVLETTIVDHQSVIYRNGAADFEMNAADVQDLDYAAYGCLIGTGTMLAAEPSRSASFLAFELARKAGIPVALDLDYRPYSWTSGREASETYARAAKMCDIVIGNDDEFGVMAGDYAKGKAYAEQLISEGVSIAIYKMGERGSVTFTADGSFDTGVFKVDALKPTGAGDSFMGALMSSLADGNPLQDAVRRGAAAAAIVVTKVGCAPAMPDRATLETFMAGHPGPS